MSKLLTSKDRINRATGENSEVDWSQLPADLAEVLLSRIGSGKKEEDIPDTPTYTACQDKIVNVLGYTMTFTQALQLTSVALQVVSIILCIIIATNCRCRCS